MAIAETPATVDAWQTLQRRMLAAQAVFFAGDDLPLYGPAVELALEHLAASDDLAAQRAALEEAAWAPCPEVEVLPLLRRRS